jgi:Glycosyl hydrolases family 25.
VSDAINKRIEALRRKGVEVGPPLTAEHSFGQGMVAQGYYDGVMLAFPELAEAWFVKDFESQLVVPSSVVELPPETVGGGETRLVNSIDISNHQRDLDLAAILNDWDIEYCIVRIPTSVEPASLAAIARDQISIVLDNDVRLGAYFWLYRDIDIERQVSEVSEFLQGYQLQANLLWPDIEPYQNNTNMPSLPQIKLCTRLIVDYERDPGIYTGPWCWALLGNPVDEELNALPLWSAEYNQQANLDHVTLYGGWTHVAGHQYTSNPLDRNVFDSVVLGL